MPEFHTSPRNELDLGRFFGPLSNAAQIIRIQTWPGRLWKGDISQLEIGWPADPMRLGANGPPHGFDEGEVGRAFRPPVVQADKIRACDDLKYGFSNPRYGGRTPISLPTWGHIGEMRPRMADADRGWPFFTTYREDANKNLHSHRIPPNCVQSRGASRSMVTGTDSGHGRSFLDPRMPSCVIMHLRG